MSMLDLSALSLIAFKEPIYYLCRFYCLILYLWGLAYGPPNPLYLSKRFLLRVPYFHSIFTVFSQYFHSIFTVFSQYFHNIFTIFSLYFHSIFIVFSQYFHSVWVALQEFAKKKVSKVQLPIYLSFSFSHSSTSNFSVFFKYFEIAYLYLSRLFHAFVFATWKKHEKELLFVASPSRWEVKNRSNK